MTTDIKICSDASVLIGAAPIQSFDEGTAESITASAIYEDTYENLLRYRPWTFAREYFYPNKINKTPNTGYKYAYLIPNTVVSIMDIAEGKGGRQDQFKLVGKNELHTDVVNPRVYALIKPKEGDLPADFVLALKYAIASEMSVPITDNTTKAQFYEQKLAMQIKRAADNDLAQEPAEDIGFNSELYYSHYNSFTG
jgi:hypothetical protein